MLPTPLAVSRHTTASASSSGNPMSSSSSVAMARSSDGGDEGFDPSASAHRLISSPQSAVVDHWNDAYEPPASPPVRPPRESYPRPSMETPPGSANPFMRGVIGSGSPGGSGSGSPVMYDEPEERPASPPSRYGSSGSPARGVRLTDSGPVPGPRAACDGWHGPARGGYVSSTRRRGRPGPAATAATAKPVLAQLDGLQPSAWCGAAAGVWKLVPRVFVRTLPSCFGGLCSVSGAEGMRSIYIR
ncbi:hypothetical protein B0H17DRAFT_352532 [Mycena rosella]|uniref:Uncharacterized protein n=1 Tax=Mycena rosella TaxID=1033263 RepID=A0AAD7CQZ1_MYCRO|nr:hypothetical protein B0H17DRAFT_352532 [Mycena rosella]